jgi:hypothetical protein
MPYYTKYGKPIRNVRAYASTGAPMYKGKSSNNINKRRSIYKVECQNGKKYIGETGNFNKRINQHFNGAGSKVTQKFKPKSARELDRVPGYFAKEAEQYYTEKNMVIRMSAVVNILIQ